MLQPDDLMVVISHLRALAGAPALAQASVGRPSRGYAGPGGRKTAEVDEDTAVAQAIARALRREIGDCRSPDEAVARLAGGTPRAARDWRAGKVAPQAARLIRLIGSSDAVFDAVLELAGRKRPGEMSAADRDLIARALRIIDRGTEQ